MPTYQTWIDPRAAVTRSQLSRIEIRDLCSATMRWALHFSHEEMEYLERHNPDTLGAWGDPALYNTEWKKFVDHPESQPYRVKVKA